jgi:Ser/Thr protein kinase RdoA (MazF antagonist)
MPLTAGGPRDVSTLEPVPHGHTARRLDWLLLPPMTRRLVEDRFGTRVVDAVSAEAGYTPGCASVLTGADGRRIFLKAASKRAQRPFADAYREEIRKLRSLPSGLPVPQLLWSHEDDLWVVLALEHLDGTNPQRPWRDDQLASCLDTLEELADALTPPPMRLRTLADELGGQAACWDHVRRTAPGWPHLDEAARLADRFTDATRGATVVHTDVRDDNLLVDDRGRASLCDWNFPVEGAAWVDTVCLLVTAAGDGIDADALLSGRRLTRHVPPDDVDAVLALLCGFFLRQRDQPVPHSSPYLRRHQDWSAEASWAWLAQRRGWG